MTHAIAHITDRSPGGRPGDPYRLTGLAVLLLVATALRARAWRQGEAAAGRPASELRIAVRDPVSPGPACRPDRGPMMSRGARRSRRAASSGPVQGRDDVPCHGLDGS